MELKRRELAKCIAATLENRMAFLPKYRLKRYSTRCTNSKVGRAVASLARCRTPFVVPLALPVEMNQNNLKRKHIICSWTCITRY